MFVGIVGLVSPCSVQTSQVVQRWKGQRWVSKKPVAGFQKMGTDGPPQEIKQGPLVGDLEHFFPYIGNNSPNRLIFFRGVETTNQYTYYGL
jgi:hypothetical protein